MPMLETFGNYLSLRFCCSKFGRLVETTPFADITHSTTAISSSGFMKHQVDKGRSKGSLRSMVSSISSFHMFKLQLPRDQIRNWPFDPMVHSRFWNVWAQWCINQSYHRLRRFTWWCMSKIKQHIPPQTLVSIDLLSVSIDPDAPIPLMVVLDRLIILV